MIELNLIAKTKEQELIKEYLQNNASEILANKINNGIKIQKDNKELICKKTLDGFMKYASEEAKKIAQNGATYACIEDNVVYGWAIHYFEEESIAGELFNVDGSEYIEQKQIAKPNVKTIDKKKNKSELQTSLFDLLESDECEHSGYIEKPENLQEDTEPSEEEIEEMKKEIAEQDRVELEKTSHIYKQYMDIQNKYPDHIIAYRIGDFYEIYGENAITLANELEITLTSRDFNTPHRIATIGLPWYSSDVYFEKIRKNHKLAQVNCLADVITLSCDKKTQTIDCKTGEVLSDENENDRLLAKLMQIFEGKIIVR